MHVDESGSISHKDNTKYYVLSGAIVNIDEIVLRPPSAENAKRLVEMQIRVVTQSTLLKKLPEDWLPYMINAGFFKDLQPTVFTSGHPNYVNWAPSQYLIKCVNAFPKEVMCVSL